MKGSRPGWPHFEGLVSLWFSFKQDLGHNAQMIGGTFGNGEPEDSETSTYKEGHGSVLSWLNACAGSVPELACWPCTSIRVPTCRSNARLDY